MKTREIYEIGILGTKHTALYIFPEYITRQQIPVILANLSPLSKERDKIEHLESELASLGVEKVRVVRKRNPESSPFLGGLDIEPFMYNPQTEIPQSETTQSLQQVS